MFNHINTDLGYEEINRAEVDGKRHYVTPEGNIYPSVTTALAPLSSAGIAKWKKRVGEEEAKRVGYRACERGTKVHSIIERYLDNNPAYSTGFFPDVKFTFYEIKPLIERIDNIRLQERGLYSDHLKLAGTPDCIGEFDGKLSVIDFKTSKKPKKKKWIVTLIAVDGNEPQVFEEKRDNWAPKLLTLIQ
jgi:genome maintenance exonuclease 1